MLLSMPFGGLGGSYESGWQEWGGSNGHQSSWSRRGEYVCVLRAIKDDSQRADGAEGTDTGIIIR